MSEIVVYNLKEKYKQKMAGRVIAQMIIQGASILGRAVITAYSQVNNNSCFILKFIILMLSL